jgi:hypothetical protein
VIKIGTKVFSKTLPSGRVAGCVEGGIRQTVGLSLSSPYLMSGEAGPTISDERLLALIGPPDAPLARFSCERSQLLETSIDLLADDVDQVRHDSDTGPPDPPFRAIVVG